MTDQAGLESWVSAAGVVEHAGTVWTVQLAEHWFADQSWSRARDELDLALFRGMLRGRIGTLRRLLLYDPPSDLGGAPPGYHLARGEHERWLARVCRHLAAVGAPSSAGSEVAVHASDHRVRLVILPRAGRRPTIEVSDGIWIDSRPPATVLAAWDGPGLIALDPHEENIIGPHSDRNPLWVGNVT